MTRPFDLEAAKRGEAVQTTDGRAVRILCFDRRKSMCPIIGFVTDRTGWEELGYWDEEGFYTANSSHILNLVMVTAKNFRTEWVNVYSHTSIGYSNKRAADEQAMSGLLACIQRTIEWES